MTSSAPAPCVRPVLPSGRPHGTYATYRAGCGCLPCRGANAADANRRRLGHRKLIDAEPVRQHLAALRGAGLGLRRIATLSDVRMQTLQALVGGTPRLNRPPTRHVTAVVAARILAIDPLASEPADGVPVRAIGAQRRLQALIRMGWSYTELAQRLGCNPAHISYLLSREQLQFGTVRRIRELFDELWNVAPPENTDRERAAAARSRRTAFRNKWAPPMAWDEDTIDDPAAEPQGVDYDHAPRYGLPRGDELLWLLQYETRPAIADRFHVGLGAVNLAIQRAEIAAEKAAKTNTKHEQETAA